MPAFLLARIERRRRRDRTAGRDDTRQGTESGRAEDNRAVSVPRPTERRRRRGDRNDLRRTAADVDTF